MNAISKIETLMEYEKENCLIDYFICNNNLESTLFKALELSGIKLSNNKQAEIMSMPRKTPLPENGNQPFTMTAIQKI